MRIIDVNSIQWLISKHFEQNFGQQTGWSLKAHTWHWYALRQVWQYVEEQLVKVLSNLNKGQFTWGLILGVYYDYKWKTKGQANG